MVGKENIAEENDSNEVITDSKIINNDSKTVQDDTNKERPTESIVNTSEQNNSSIKMIIGGSSEGGVAKQVILPIKD